MPKKTKPPIEIEDTNGFLTVKGTDTCLGNLMHFGDEHGTFDATLGKVDVSKEAADRHNELFNQALLDGLDKNCEVGMGGSFYLAGGKNKPHSVTTFTGKLVSDEVRVLKGRGRAAHGSRGDKVFFARNGMTFEGYTTGDADLLNFTRKT